MKKKVTVPESFDDISLGDLQKIRALEGDEEFITIKTIEILAGMRGDEILKMKHSDRDKIVAELEAAIKVTPSKHIKHFHLNGIEFGFHPNLNGMSYGEWVDLELYFSDFGQIHKVMSLLYRPIIKKSGNLYDIEPYQGTGQFSEMMKKSPSSIALGMMVFFCDLGKALLNNSLKSLREEESLRIHKKSSQKNGDGMRQLVTLLERTSSNLNRLQTYHLNNALPRLHTTLISTN